MIRVTSDAYNWFKTLSDKHISSTEELNSRTNICVNCPNMIKTLGVERCNECGCLIFLKSRLKSQECPLGNWEPILNSDGDNLPSAAFF